MRLLTHNMLQCHVKGCTKDNFPLKIQEAELDNVEAEFNQDFIKRMIPKLEWSALVATSFELGVERLPESVPEDLNEEFLQKLHKVLLETRIKQGTMVCRGCGHVYPIKDAIPNMLLSEKEV